MYKRIILPILLLIGATALFPSAPPATEVRAVWLATNYGLDWPHNHTSVEEQKRELTAILDNLKAHNFNTVIFQVRGRGEVCYHSQIEPMSTFIAPSGLRFPTFDPLAFVVEECHTRGLECHAWVVTYPLGKDQHVRSLGARSVTKRNPSITRQFRGEWFLDPGDPQTDDYLLQLVREIVAGYDVDGIHFDYIRYPEQGENFPDDGTYYLYGGGKPRQEWRRDNITRFVTKAYDRVKALKPWVQVSSAPLGRYRALNGNDEGWTALESVSQDAGKWLMTGKHDAVYPMMYYKEDLFYPYVDDWLEHANGRIVTPGLGAFRMIELEWSRSDILNQVDYTRRRDTHGQAYFRAENLLSDTDGILMALRPYYGFPAKLPPMTWLNSSPPDSPQDLRAETNEEGIFELFWEKDNRERITYNVYRSETDTLSLDNAEKLIAAGLRQPLYTSRVEANDKAYYYYITASDAYHNESRPCIPAFFYHSHTVK
ncbi:MAG: family 10 glycosylhydrolase [Proteiniphilum sp.]|jgi:uncharacterized lipoprotein YddW (UPF0748 family)|nr:family 10 glycosylhydrolase [Proteiniphilum sp.]